MAYRAEYQGILRVDLTLAPYTLPFGASNIGNDTAWDCNSDDATISMLSITSSQITSLNAFRCSRTGYGRVLYGNGNGVNSRQDGVNIGGKLYVFNTLDPGGTTPIQYRTYAIPVPTSGTQNISGMSLRTYATLTGDTNIQSIPAGQALYGSPYPIRWYVDCAGADDTKFVDARGNVETVTPPLTLGQLLDAQNALVMAAQQKTGNGYRTLALNTAGGLAAPIVYDYARDFMQISTVELEDGPSGSNTAFQTLNATKRIWRVAGGFIVRLPTSVFVGMGARLIYLNTALSKWYDIQLASTNATVTSMIARSSLFLTMNQEGYFFFKNGQNGEVMNLAYGPVIPPPNFPTVYPHANIPRYQKYDTAPIVENE